MRRMMNEGFKESPLQVSKVCNRQVAYDHGRTNAGELSMGS